VLGIGGRIGMRGIALAEGRQPLFTIEGSIAVALLGGAVGALVAVLFLVARTVAPAHRLLRTALFWALLGLLVWRGLNPVSTINVAIFAPLFVLHGALLTAYWCRIRFRRAALLYVRA